MSKTVIGVWGAGVVGQATGFVFEKLCPDKTEIIYYDKFKKEFSENKEDLLNRSEFIFLCLPTPMKITGEVSLEYIDESLKEINDYLKDNVQFSNQIFIIRSTSVSGSTDAFALKYPSLTFAFCPEFLTEANSKEDSLLANKVIIGANDFWVYKKIEALFKLAYEGSLVSYVFLTRAEAEMFKYFSNVFLAAQVMISNEIYFVCRKMGLNYDKIRKPLLLDRRIGTFTQVPGPDGDFGVGGKCLVPETMVRIKEKGLITLDEAEEGDEIFDGNGYTKVIKKGERFVSEMIELKAGDGELTGSITGSFDHIQPVWEENIYKEKYLKDIGITDTVSYISVQEEQGNFETLEVGIEIISLTKKKGGRVISLETKSGFYVANNIKTHNCFPKDVNAFIYLAKEKGVIPHILETMMKYNDHIRMKKDWLSIEGAVESCKYDREKTDK